jgi:hypothetical protein
MKALALVMMLAACTKASSSGQGSGDVPTPKTVPGGSAASAPVDAEPSPTPMTTKPDATAVRQPKRTPEDAAQFTAAEQAIDAAVDKAKHAASAKAACSVVDDVANKLGGLDHVKPPSGFEKEFAQARDGIGMAIDNIRTTICPDAASTPDDVADGLQRVRSKLEALEGIGA